MHGMCRITVCTGIQILYFYKKFTFTYLKLVIISFDVPSSIIQEKTGSGRGAAILEEWDKYLPLFWQLVPPSEEDTPEACADYEQTAAGQVTFQSA